MKPDKINITGVVLAGGRGSRMDGQDKGLVIFRGKPMVSYALEALKSVTGQILISANRNIDLYAAYGYPVIKDYSENFDGPLAGLYSALTCADTPYVMTIPCDSPFVNHMVLTRMLDAMDIESTSICTIHDGNRLQSAFMIAHKQLIVDLENYLSEGKRKVETWLKRHNLVVADVSDFPELFTNINTTGELTQLETKDSSFSITPKPAP